MTIEDDGWISVEDRLPEEGRHVLVEHNTRHGCQRVAYYDDGEWWPRTDCGYGPLLGIEYWRPLPAPREGE